MSYYRVFPHCGAHLDPGERCDRLTAEVCEEARAASPERFTGKSDAEIISEINVAVKKATVSVSSTDGGEAEQNLTPVSVSSLHENGGYVNERD